MVAEDVGLFGYYFFLITNHLLNDYYLRSYVKSDFYKQRAAYLRKPNLTPSTSE
jgi:hypothetical protein